MSDETERNLKFKMGKTAAGFYEKSAHLDQELAKIFENPQEVREKIAERLEKYSAEDVLKAVKRNPRFFGKTRGSRLSSKGREERKEAKEARQNIGGTFKEMRNAYDERARQGDALNKHRAHVERSEEKKPSKKAEKSQVSKKEKPADKEPKLREVSKQEIHENQKSGKEKAVEAMAYLARRKEARQKAKDGATPDAAFAKLEAEKKKKKDKKRQRDNEWEPE